MRAKLEFDLATPEAPPATSVQAALKLLKSGFLFRYAEMGSEGNEAALLEQEFATLLARKYCIAVNSGGSAIFLALKAAGVQPGDKVLLNAFTLAPVPGAIEHLNAEAVLVEINQRLVIDIDDLRKKAESSGAKYLLMSHMRGHVADMEAVSALCENIGIKMIEDCAHTMGATWNGVQTGNFGIAGAFSSQSYKQFNTGEGGLIVTDDEDLAARAILMSGSYMLYAQHSAAPPEAVFARWKGTCANHSMRMSALVAAILRPQLPLLPTRNARWRWLHDRIAARLKTHQLVRLPERPPEEDYTPTSLQFFMEGLSQSQIEAVIADSTRHGVPIKFFGGDVPTGFTSRAPHWAYIAPQPLPRSETVLATLCDIRLPLGLSETDADTLAQVVIESLNEALP
ncbi:MAG: DegT/DnrJ/EryC1/StrS family aminotransferase [Rhodobacteraceae bacterium]|nr:DegT/DnrJ/EryC1/StrS family aminotransferase [Paracoccaceae bacterium]